MSVKEEILHYLRNSADRYVSGNELAERLGVSRTAVWKAVTQLKKDGYLIDSVTNRGYRYSSFSDVLTAAGIMKYAKAPVRAIVYDSVTSTNTVAKKLAENGADEGTLVAANQQTGGKGRLGRSFYSPPGSGLYMSLVLRPNGPAASNLTLTAAAAVAVAESIEEITGKKTRIKWVNDILVGGRKAVGILTEGALDCETGNLNYAVVGIGINTHIPENDFPEEIRGIAGAVYTDDEPVPELRCRLAATVANRILEYSGRSDRRIHDAYIARSTVLGKKVNLYSGGKLTGSGTVLAIDDAFALVIEAEDGKRFVVNTGEISLREAEK